MPWPLPCRAQVPALPFAYSHLPSAKSCYTARSPTRQGSRDASAVAVLGALGALGALVVRFAFSFASCENARRLSASNLRWYRHRTPAYSPPTNVPQWHKADGFCGQPTRAGPHLPERPTPHTSRDHGTGHRTLYRVASPIPRPTRAPMRFDLARGPYALVYGSSHGAPGRPLHVIGRSHRRTTSTAVRRATGVRRFCGPHPPRTRSASARPRTSRIAAGPGWRHDLSVCAHLLLYSNRDLWPKFGNYFRFR